jgi:PhnB protein
VSKTITVIASGEAMQSTLNPYISFKDNAREAMEFYQTIFGGKLDITTFKEFNLSGDASEDNKVMHAMLTTDSDMIIMASDTPNAMEFKPGANVSISISGRDEPELRGYFEKLSNSGIVAMPLEKARWGDLFGMVVDKFGTSWMVSVTISDPAATLRSTTI